MQFWDYLYLDVNRLQDYWSRLDGGSVDSVKELKRLASESSPATDLAPQMGSPGKDAVTREEETVREQVVTITAKHSFSKLYEQLQPHLKTLEEDAGLADAAKGSIIEVTREFEPSPVTQMMNSLFQLMEMMQGLGSIGMPDLVIDDETRTAMSAMSLLFRPNGEDEERGLPLVSSGEGTDQLSILFVADPSSLLCDPEALEGEMTLLGKVQRQVAAGKELDLFEHLKVLPRALRRSGGANGMRNSIVELFGNWPTELGGPVDPRAMVLRGPAIVVSPLAVYN